MQGFEPKLQSPVSPPFEGAGVEHACLADRRSFSFSVPGLSPALLNKNELLQTGEESNLRVGSLNDGDVLSLRVIWSA